MDKPISFSCEVVKVSVKKTLSMDKEFTIQLSTDSAQALQLAAFVNEQAITVTVEPQK